MEEKNSVLSAMNKAQKPLSAGQISEITGLDRKVVDKAMKLLKSEGLIVSPKVCYWEPAKK